MSIFSQPHVVFLFFFLFKKVNVDEVKLKKLHKHHISIVNLICINIVQYILITLNYSLKMKKKKVLLWSTWPILFVLLIYYYIIY